MQSWKLLIKMKPHQTRSLNDCMEDQTLSIYLPANALGEHEIIFILFEIPHIFGLLEYLVCIK